MKVFICWSGERGGRIAKELRDWLKRTIQAAKPFMSEEDIEKGSNWEKVISEELCVTDYGIVCVTPESKDSLWIHYEAGALAKNFGTCRVCPLLFDLKGGDVIGPLAKFQAAEFNYENFLKMAVALNNALDENKMEVETLKEVYQSNWPKLESAIKEALKTTSKPPEEPPARSPDELLREVLDIVRGLEASMTAQNRAVTTASRLEALQRREALLRMAALAPAGDESIGRSRVPAGATGSGEQSLFETFLLRRGRLSPSHFGFGPPSPTSPTGPSGPTGPTGPS